MNSHSPASERIAVAACGALASDIAAIAQQQEWPIDVHPLPPLLHNHPADIAPALDGLITDLKQRYTRILVGYADCGSGGAIDQVCTRHGVQRLAGWHCYDVYAGAGAIEELMAAEPGTYLLTDFLVLGFRRLVWVELGLDRHPELLPDYFGNYRRVVWLAGRRTPDLERAAQRAAQQLGLPLQIRPIPRDGTGGLTAELARHVAKLGPLHTHGR
jgi:hypothetical protein